MWLVSAATQTKLYWILYQVYQVYIYLLIMMRSKRKNGEERPASLLGHMAFFMLGLLITTGSWILNSPKSSPPTRIVESFLAEVSKDNKAEAQKYWCYPNNEVFHHVDNWTLESQRKSKSLQLNTGINIEKIADAFPDVQANLYRLSRFENVQLVYLANASTKSGSQAMSKQWVFDVWEKDKLLRYRKLAESILSDMHADVENPRHEGEDLEKSINAARYASLFAGELAHHPGLGNLADLSDLPYCIMSVQEAKDNNQP